MSIGIYKIENLINHKIYIGQSVRIEKRWYEHYTYKKGVIGEAISKYGVENFSFQILEECSVDELNQKEVDYIQRYNSLAPNGYNISSGGKSNHEIFYFKVPEDIEAIRQDLLESSLSFDEISKKYNISKRDVYYINNGTYHHLDEYSYPIRQVQDLTKKVWICEVCGTIVSKGCHYCRSCAAKKYLTNSPGNLLSREELKDLIRTKSFIEIGRMFGVSNNAVKKWCDKHNLPRKTSEIKKITDEEWQEI